MQIEMWDIGRPKPYAKNARKIPEAAVAKVALSLKTFGWQQPLVVDEHDVIICGHTRLLSARSLGLSKVPVHIAAGLTPEQVRQYRLMDNRSHEDAKWDMEILAVELGELKGLDLDMTLTGFELPELNRILPDGGGLTDPDAVPEPPKVPITKPGDLWLLGNHRLLCGDSTCATDVDRVLGGVKPLLMVTDPPYGVDFDPTWRKGSEGRQYMGDKPDKEFAWEPVWKLFPGDVIYVWHAAARTVQIWDCLIRCGFEYRAQIMWDKARFIIGRGHYCYNHEPCFYGVRKKGTSGWQGAQNQPTVWSIKHVASDTNHGAQKPVECMKRPIENSSSPRQAVYDPFLGSGTTIIAAEMTGRACIGLELEPGHCDVIVKRWQDFTGQSATLEATGQTMEQVKFGRALGAQDAIKEEVLEAMHGKA